MINRFSTLVRKEFWGYLNSPLAYLVIVPFLLLSHFLFFRDALLIGDGNLRPFFELLPWFLIIIAPALAMRVFADEYKEETLELLYAHPLPEWQIVVAKFLGLVAFFGLLLLATLALPIVLLVFSKPDPGVMFGQYLSGLFIGSAFLAVGLMVSAYIKNTVGSFLVGAAVSFLLVLVGMPFILLMLPAPFNMFVGELAVLSHVTNLSRGVIDFRDILYFVSITGIALVASTLKLSERKVVERPWERRKLLLGLGLVALVGLAGNYLMYEFPLQLDLTQDKRYSLSSGTKQLISSLPDRVNLTLYTSANLPGPLQVNLKQTHDLLRDYRQRSNKISLKTVVVEPGSKERQEALQRGIQEVNFNQIGAGSFQVQAGVFGLVARYGDKTEVIPYLNETANLEYQLSRLILKMTGTSQTKLGLVDNGTQTASFVQGIEEQYQVSRLTGEETAETWKDLAAVIVIDGGETPQATVAAKLEAYLNQGGSGAFFIDGVAVNGQTLSATANTSGLAKILEPYGIVVKNNLVYDLQLNETIRLGNGPMQYLIPYPFWMRTLTNKAAVPWSAQSGNVLVGWASQIEIAQDQRALSFQPLLTSGPMGGLQQGTFTVHPDQIRQLQPTQQAIPVAAVATKDSQRVAVIADTQFLSEEFLTQTAENQAFASNLVDWVAKDPILASIPRRAEGRNAFAFESPSQVQTMQIAAIGVPPVLVAVFGMYWLRRRRILSRRSWS